MNVDNLRLERLDCIKCDLGIGSENRNPRDLRLRHKESIKGIAVVWRERSDAQGVAMKNGEGRDSCGRHHVAHHLLWIAWQLQFSEGPFDRDLPCASRGKEDLGILTLQQCTGLGPEALRVSQHPKPDLRIDEDAHL